MLNEENITVHGKPSSYPFAYAYPEAHTFFVEYISKAYQALTDPVSRENYEKYGHPDGRQVMLKLSVHSTSLKTKFYHHLRHQCLKLT
jgi:DnaJ-class molecular chaperone